MKKYYYMAVIATVAIICFQAIYVLNLYDHYVAEKIISIGDVLEITIDKELYLRTRDSKRQEVKGQQRIYFRATAPNFPIISKSVIFAV